VPEAGRAFCYTYPMQFTVFDFFWLIFLVSAFMPLLRQRALEAQRVRLFRTLEARRGSRVIAMIHRQETLSFFGLPFFRYINIEDSEEILRVIRMTPDDMPIDLILHTPGGLVLASEQIAMALSKHKGKVTVFVPHYAMSGGTLIALAADEIVMDTNAVLGPVDPQLNEYPAVSVLRAVERKNLNDLEDRTLILADVAEKAMRQVYRFVFNLIAEKMGEEKADQVARALTEGRYTHDFPLTCDDLIAMGLPVSCAVPDEIYALMALYPQAPTMRPSVQYIPTPYKQQERKGPNP